MGPNLGNIFKKFSGKQGQKWGTKRVMVKGGHIVKTFVLGRGQRERGYN